MKKISTKIKLVVALLGAIIIGVSILMYGVSRDIEDELKEISTIDFKNLISSIELIDELGDVNGESLNYLLGESSRIIDLNEDLDEFHLELEIIKNNSSGDSLEKIDKVIELLNLYEVKTKLIIDTYNPKNEKIGKSILNELKEESTQLKVLTNQLIRKEFEKIFTKKNNSLHEQNMVKNYFNLNESISQMLSEFYYYMNGKENINKELETFKNSFLQTVDIIKNSNLTQEESQILKKIEDKFNDISLLEEKFIKSYNPSNRKEAIRIYKEEQSLVKEELEDLLGEITLSNEKKVNYLLDHISSQLIVVSNVLIAISFISVIVIIFSLIILSKNVIRPINNLTEIMKDIAEGEGDLTKRIPLKNMDEIGLLSMYFNKFLDDLSNILTNIKSATNETKINSKIVAFSIKNIALGNTVENFSEIQDALEKGILQLEGNINSVVDSINEQVSATEQSMANLEEISASVMETSRNSQNIKEKTNNAVEISNAGLVKLIDIQNSVTSIEASLDKSNNKIQNLVSLSGHIEGILLSINSLSEQTNLLALNAAIEAARAGDAGRGFSVVAEEIRKLAEKTNDETKKIEKTISSIQHEIDDVKSSINEVNENVEINSTLSNELNLQTKQICSIVEGINIDISSISNSILEEEIATQEISKVFEEITNNSSRIEEKSNETSNITLLINERLNEKLTNLSQLESQIENIENMINKFKLV